VELRLEILAMHYVAAMLVAVEHKVVEHKV
jgi:hypothetical protein